MLTTGYEDTSCLQENIREMVLDWLAAGLDPEKCVIFKQSAVPEHAELALLLGMLTPLPLLLNNPTYKESLRELFNERKLKILAEKERGFADQNSAALIEEAIDANVRTQGLLGYPLLQAADILLYHTALVPIGKDQLPHLELSREIVRRFNRRFGKIFVEPEALLTSTPKVPGTDGRKMSKSYGNTIELFETEESLKKKIATLYTDPSKIKVSDPGHPEPCPENPPGCSVFALHQIYGTKDFVQSRGRECRAGSVGCVACKKDLLSEMSAPFAAFREKRKGFSSSPERVEKILESGATKAREVAEKTMERVRRAMKLL